MHSFFGNPLQAGGIGPELDEDFSTSLLMTCHGFKGCFSIMTPAGNASLDPHARLVMLSPSCKIIMLSQLHGSCAVFIVCSACNLCNSYAELAVLLSLKCLCLAFTATQIICAHKLAVQRVACAI